MTRAVHACSVIVLLLILGGCGARKPIGAGPDVVFVVPGVAGDGLGYNGLIRALRDADPGTVRVFAWGAPKPLFFANFSSASIHDRAEVGLAEQIDAWRCENPGARVLLVGHSAGCGVILGALPRLTTADPVNEVVLLAPSVSPGYDLAPAMQRVSGSVHVFFSERDTLFLKWRTGNFGTYDRIRTPAAGHLGFDASKLPADLRPRLVQHPHDPQWQRLKNNGGHFGALSEPFARERVTPLLRPSRSSEASLD